MTSSSRSSRWRTSSLSTPDCGSLFCQRADVPAYRSRSPASHNSRKCVGRRLALWRREGRKVPLAEIELYINAVGNLLTAGNRIFEPRKRRVHLFRAAQKKLIALHPHPIRIGAELAGVDAQQHVLRDRILAQHVMRVARGHERQPHPLRECDRKLLRLPLDFEAVVLNLDEVPLAKRAMKPGRMLLTADERFIRRVARKQRAAQLARNASAQAHNPVAVGGQQFPIDPRLVIKPLQKRLARQASRGSQNPCDSLPRA